eukprot:symbB.v1.2.018248.t1/scaffold1447.1/size118252/8
MSKRLTIIQGPPGTGKTHTSVRILSNWVKTMGYRPLLATSECNVAVDNIAEGLVANGIKVVRIGHAEKVSQRLEEAILNKLVLRSREQLKEEGYEQYDDDVVEDTNLPGIRKSGQCGVARRISCPNIVLLNESKTGS